MDIGKTTTLSWDAPTKRTDGTPIQGVISYIVELVQGTTVVKTWPVSTTSKAFNFEQEGIAPGAYTLFARSQEDYNGSGKVSARSVGLPLSLEVVAPPMAPINLKVV